MPAYVLAPPASDRVLTYFTCPLLSLLQASVIPLFDRILVNSYLNPFSVQLNFNAVQQLRFANIVHILYITFALLHLIARTTLIHVQNSRTNALQTVH